MRFRLGLIIGGFVSLCAGAALRLDLDAAPGNRRRISVPQPEFFVKVRSGDEVVIDGSGVRLLVMSAASDHAETIVLSGGYVSDARRVTIPTCTWPGTLSRKDRTDAAYAAALGVEWLALPATCGVAGFAEIRNLVGAHPRLMARFDNLAALATIEDTLLMADGILFGRHELAMSLPEDELSRLQKKLFMHCRAAGKMMVAATQALAECGQDTHHSSAAFEDIAAALRCGAHVLMLSSGPAFGAFPVESVAMMERFIRTAECGICPEEVQDTRPAQGAMPIQDVMYLAPQTDLPEFGDRLPLITMRKRSGDLCTPDDGFMTTSPVS